MRPKPTPPPTPNLTICCATSRWRWTPCACATRPARAARPRHGQAGRSAESGRRDRVADAGVAPAGRCAGAVVAGARCGHAPCADGNACRARPAGSEPRGRHRHRHRHPGSASSRRGSRANGLSSRLTSTTLGCTTASRRGWCGSSSTAASSCAHRLGAGACRRCCSTPAASAAPPGVVTARVFAPRFHEIFNEPEQAEVCAVLAAWLSPPSMTRR